MDSIYFFCSKICTVDWLIANFGTILGAGIGALSAYLIGAYQTRKQIQMAQLPERIRQAKRELPIIRDLKKTPDVIIREVVGLYRDSKNNWSRISKKILKRNLSLWEKLTDTRIVNTLDALVLYIDKNKPILKLKESENGMKDKIMENMVLELVRITKYLAESERDCIDILGLNKIDETKLSSYFEISYWGYFIYRLINFRIFNKIKKESEKGIL